MHLAFCLDGCLAQEGCALGKLGVKLIVEVDSVRHDHDGRAVQRLLQQMGIENHGQRFSAALGMPEHAAFAVGLGCDDCFLHSLANSEVLVVASQNLKHFCLLHGEANKVLEDIQQPRLVEHPLIEGVKLGISGVLVATIFGLPLHEAVKARSDCPRLVCGQIANYANGVVIENGGDVLHVIADLVVCVFRIDLILGRTFQLHQNQRQSVDEQDNVGAAVVAIFDVCKLVDHIETVVRNDLVVDQVYNGIAFLALDKVSDRNAVLQIVHELHVLLQQTACVKIAELADGFVDCVQRHSLIQFHKAVQQNSV